MGANTTAIAYASTTLPTTAETTVTISAPVSVNLGAVPQPGNVGASGVLVRGSVNVNVGTGGTGLTIRCREGSLTGSVLGSVGISVAAGGTYQIPFDFVDTSPFTNGGQYYITVQQAAATANGTCNLATVSVTVLNPTL